MKEQQINSIYKNLENMQNQSKNKDIEIQKLKDEKKLLEQNNLDIQKKLDSNKEMSKEEIKNNKIENENAIFKKYCFIEP